MQGGVDGPEWLWNAEKMNVKVEGARTVYSFSCLEHEAALPPGRLAGGGGGLFYRRFRGKPEPKERVIGSHPKSRAGWLSLSRLLARGAGGSGCNG